MRNSTSLFAAAVFLFTLILPLTNQAPGVLGFADAAEFNLVSYLSGVAHAPGFPAYTILSSLFLVPASAFAGTVTSLVFFSALCLAVAALLLFFSALRLLSHLKPEATEPQLLIAAAITAAIPVTGTTLWHWTHSVEVYTLQTLFVTLVLHGLILREDGHRRHGTLLAAIGFGLGLANHHLTAVFLFPFLVILWPSGWLKPNQSEGKKKTVNKGVSWNELTGSDARLFAGIVTGIVVLAYGWLMVRSTVNLPFAFGNPDTLDRLIYHLSGGAWMKNTQSVVKGIVGMRLPYFLRITWEQFFLFSGFLVYGLVALSKSGYNRFWLAIAGYFAVIFIYQLRIDQTADTDAYLCTAYFLLTLLAAPGILLYARYRPYTWVTLPLLLVAQTWINFSKTDLRDFDLSTAILRDLDRSAPKGSVVLIADWTASINALNARITQNFRKDLVVLNYDLKFTHHELFKRNYPEVYAEVAAPYERFIGLLGQYHPQEIYNTGCTLDQRDLLNAYLDAIRALQNYCSKRGVAFMADPKAYVFLVQQGVFPDTHVSGSYLSTLPGTPEANDAFLRLEHNWIDNRHVLSDPSAADKLVDLEAALDMHRRYWQQKGDTTRLRIAENKYQDIKRRQRDMKKKMAFLFRR